MQRILLVYDVDGWAWHGLARGIQTYAPAGYEVSLLSEKRCPRNPRFLSRFDAVLWFSWTTCPLEIKASCRRLWTVLDHHGGLYAYTPNARWTPDVAATPTRNVDLARRRLPQFSGLIAKNRFLEPFCRSLHEATVFLPGGVDVTHWTAAPVSLEGPLRVGWCGQRTADDPWRSTKGLMQVFEPLRRRLADCREISFQVNTASYRRGALTRDEMVRWYHAVDVLLCTSSTEGAPLPVFEAAACGRPIVSTAVGAVPELLEEGRSGFLLGRFENEAEAARVVELAEDRLLRLARDRRLLCRMAAEIRQKIVEEFCWSRLAPRWLAALLDVPAEPPRVAPNRFAWRQVVPRMERLFAWGAPRQAG